MAEPLRQRWIRRWEEEKQKNLSTLSVLCSTKIQTVKETKQNFHRSIQKLLKKCKKKKQIFFYISHLFYFIDLFFFFLRNCVNHLTIDFCLEKEDGKIIKGRGRSRLRWKANEANSKWPEKEMQLFSNNEISQILQYIPCSSSPMPIQLHRLQQYKYDDDGEPKVVL